jgi:hypothetical protein
MYSQLVRASLAGCAGGDHELEEIRSAGGTVIGERCTRCRVLWGRGTCANCGCVGRLTAVSETTEERFCSPTCRNGIASKRPGVAAKKKRRRPVRK